jgi:hypothetical protein
MIFMIGKQKPATEQQHADFPRRLGLRHNRTLPQKSRRQHAFIMHFSNKESILSHYKKGQVAGTGSVAW